MTIKRRRRAPYADSATTSDLAFLLIIYFLVMASFNINQGFLMNLPAKDTTRLVPREDLMRFDMDSGGSIRYLGTEMNISGVEREIRAAVVQHPNLAVGREQTVSHQLGARVRGGKRRTNRHWCLERSAHDAYSCPQF